MQGVGFSYCTVYPCVNDDESQAVDVYDALKVFFQGFSEFSKNEFYITGESCESLWCVSSVGLMCVQMRGSTSR
jgi:carboxypeptidase C (cathepsin A)